MGGGGSGSIGSSGSAARASTGGVGSGTASSASSTTVSATPPANSQYKAGVRYEGKCVFWNGRGGWGRVSLQGGGTIFAHNTALRPGCGVGKRRSLRRGDLVSCAVGSNVKGPLAIDVEMVAAAAAASEGGAEEDAEDEAEGANKEILGGETDARPT